MSAVYFAATRLYFLKILKKSGLSQQHLLHFYLSVIRPVLEYCLVVWHHSLSKTQCENLEAIQHRAIRVIYPVTVGMPYIFALNYAQIPSLHSRREDAKSGFQVYLSPFLLHSFPVASTKR